MRRRKISLNFLGRGQGTLNSSCRPGVREADLSEGLPAAVTTGSAASVAPF